MATNDKKRVTLYSMKKRRNARENTNRYPWAKTMCDAAVKKAGEYLGMDDIVWELPVAEGLPRCVNIGYVDVPGEYDPYAYYCPACETDLRKEYKSYPWLTDPLKMPWKIKCPHCKKLFPSNDFEKYYKSGLDQANIFRPELADRSLLKNELYPELGEGMWVDDGFGYFTGRVFKNGVTERRTFIAYYIHMGLWHDFNGNTGIIMTILKSLRDAYLYTGDIVYGRTGAILLDRVADLYPGFDIRPYYCYNNGHGMFHEGKILGCIWETYIADLLAECVDAFYPAMEDDYVIAFLSEKAKKHNITNPKSSAAHIRKNDEDNILREIYNGCFHAQIQGNFGMQQKSAITAAIVLDTFPETDEWIKWAFRYGDHIWHADEISKGNLDVPKAESYGGEYMSCFIDRFDRDGHGGDVSPGYNYIWIYSAAAIAEMLLDYDGFDMNLYENPRVVKLFTAFIPLIMNSDSIIQIGDSGEFADTGFFYETKDLLVAFNRLRDAELAKAIYLFNGNKSEGLHLSIFDEKPEQIGRDIEKVIREQGVHDLKSTVQMGFGFAALRDGTESLKRDFWMFFGNTASGHAHLDGLSIGAHAFGLNILPDLGYPEAMGTDRNGVQWSANTICHNTAIIDQKPQKGVKSGIPLHYDGDGPVKVIDAESDAYKGIAEIYRRSLVMVRASDALSYCVDFFRIKGGSEHVYSFHAQSDEIHKVSGFEPVETTWATLAGKDVAFGPDDGYPNGYSWLKNPRMCKNANGASVMLDLRLKDFRSVLPEPKDAHIKLSMLNDGNVREVTIAEGVPPRHSGNPDMVFYALVSNKGENLDSIFVSVIELYENKPFIAEIKRLTMEPKDGGGADGAFALSVALPDGRTDHIMYSGNPDRIYNINGEYQFRGFLGVRSLENGKPRSIYINDGDLLDGRVYKNRFTGEIVMFTEILGMENTITVRFDEETDPEEIAGRHIYIQNDRVENGAYFIKRAALTDSGEMLLDIGDVSLVRKLLDPYEIDGGYVYNIEKKQRFTIPVSCFDVIK